MLEALSAQNDSLVPVFITNVFNVPKPVSGNQIHKKRAVSRIFFTLLPWKIVIFSLISKNTSKNSVARWWWLLTIGCDIMKTFFCCFCAALEWRKIKERFFWCFGCGKSGVRAKYGTGRGGKETLAGKPHDFENPAWQQTWPVIGSVSVRHEILSSSARLCRLVSSVLRFSFMQGSKVMLS